MLKERQGLENSIKNLNDNLQQGLVTMESIRKIFNAINSANLNLNAAINFIIETKVTYMDSIPAPVW